MKHKTEMLACHKSQHEWLRSHHGMDEYIDSMHRHCAMRGKELKTEYAEAFTQHRGHAFPQADILHDILGG